MSNEIHQGILNVRWFAGVGSGDETVKIQAALDHPTADAVLFSANFGSTIYTVSGLVVRRSKRIIIDRGVTVRLADLSNDDVFAITAAGVTIEGEGTIDGNRANQTAGNGILVDGVDGVRIEGVTIQGCIEAGIYGRNCSRFWVRDCIVNTTSMSGIFARATTVGTDMTDVRIIGCNVDRSDDAANDEKCIAVTRDNGARNILYPIIEGNYCKMHGTPTGSNVVGIEVFASDTLGGISHARVAKNAIEGAEIAISIASRTLHSSIQDNVVKSAHGIGLEIADALYCSIQGNTVDGGDVTTTGIVVDGANVDAAGCAVVGNTVRRIGAGGQAIYATGGTPFLTITGNSVVASTANTTAVRVNTSDDVVIAGNTLDGGTTAGTGITIQNGSRVDILGNNVRRWANFGTQIAADGVTITGVRIDAANRLSGTNGTVQVLEQNGGVANEITLENLTLSPAQITSNQTAYHPGYEEIWRLTSDASRTIQGIARGYAGRRLLILNVGSQEIVLSDEDAGASAANRIDTGSGASVSLLAGDCAHLVYDGVSSLWRVVGTN